MPAGYILHGDGTSVDTAVGLFWDRTNTRLGIGTASPAEKLSVSGAIISTGAIIGHGANRTSISLEGGNGAYWQSYGNDTSTIGRFTLRQANSDFTLTREPLVIDATGAATFSSSVGIGSATPTTSGSGITFPAAQSASTNVNTLDDYEEGTWTTTFGTSNNLTGTPSLSNGIYRKVGQLVYLEGRITGLTVIATNTQTYIQFNAPIKMNVGSSNTVGNIYTYIGSTDITGVITDVGNDFFLLGVYIPKTLITSTGLLSVLYLSITYVSEN
jgi:hypothetical protein